MNAKTLLILGLILAGFVCCDNYKQDNLQENAITRSESIDEEEDILIYSIKEPYEYPVKPGTQEWTGFKTWVEMYESSQIPDDILDNIATDALAETCLSYPLAFDFLYANDELLRISQTINDFNGLDELSKRKDGAKCLVDEYEKLNKFAINRPPLYLIKESYSILAYAELLLANNAFFDKLNDNELRNLYEVSLAKLEYKLSNMYYFSYVDIKRSLLLNSKIRLKVDMSISEIEKKCLTNYINNYQYINIDAMEEVSKVANFMK